MVFDQTPKQSCDGSWQFGCKIQHLPATALEALARGRSESSACENEKIILFSSENGICNLTIAASIRVGSGRDEPPSPAEVMRLGELRADAKAKSRGSVYKIPHQKGELPEERGATGHLLWRRLEMKKILYAVAMTVLLASPALAENIGVSMAKFDDNFLTVLRNGMQDYAAKLNGVSLQVEDAQNDVSKQLSQIQNFIAQGVDAIIVNPVDTDATPKMTKLAADAGVPLVYVNRLPADGDKLPEKISFVGSNEADSGTLEMQQVCKLMGGKGDILVMMGELSNQAARQRTQDIHDVIAKPECSGIKIIQEQTGNWERTQGTDLMTNWISSGVKFDAVVSNNDEMAIGAIQALKAAGYDMKKVIVGGVDATQDALAAMKAGDLDVTVFQNAAAQGSGAVDTALKLAKGEKVERLVWVPFELVTPDNMGQYLSKN
jgi:inositol transport system substrate-binding protein